MRMTAGSVFGNIIPDTGPAVMLVPAVAGPLRRGLGCICDFGVGTFGERPLICAVLIVFVCKSHRWGAFGGGVFADTHPKIADRCRTGLVDWHDGAAMLIGRLPYIALVGVEVRGTWDIQGVGALRRIGR